MPVLVGIEASCLSSGDSMDVGAMSLQESRRPSACARGLDNEIMPGKLEKKHVPMSCRCCKEGKGHTEKPQTPKPTEGISEETEDMMNDCAQDTPTEAITPVIEPRPNTKANGMTPTSQETDNDLIDLLAEGRSRIDLTFVLRNWYAGDHLFR